MNRNLLLYIIAFFTIFLIDFGMNSYFSYKLNTENYLFYQNLINMLPFAISLLSLGTPFGVVYLTSLTKDKKKLYLQESNLFVLIVSSTIIFFMLAIYFFGTLELYILVAFLLAFFNVIKQNAVTYFLALKKLDSASFIRLNQKIIYGFLSIVLIDIFIVNLTNFSFILIFAEFIGFLVLLLRYKIIKFKAFTKIKSILKVSKYSFFSNAISMLTIALPIILLNYYGYSSKDIIIFAIAYSLLKYSGIILGPFMQLITPYFTPIKNDKVSVISYYNKFFLLILIVSFFVTIIAYYFSSDIINIFFDKKYMDAIEIFKVLLFSIPFMFLNSYTVIVISSIQSIKKTFKLSLIGFIFIFTSLLISMNLQSSLFTISVIIVTGYIFDLFISLNVFNKYHKER